MDIPTFAVTRKIPGCTTIAHISDLHVRARTDYNTPIWAALREDLASLQDKIDVIAATGDLIDNPLQERLDETGVLRAFQSVQQYLRSLCDAAKVQEDTSLCVVAGNHDYRAQGLFGRRANPVLFDQAFRTYTSHRMYPDLRLACFQFDSNSDHSKLNFATGLVKEERLIDFAAAVKILQKREDWSTLTKLAFLHHHPMPIGPTEHRQSLAGRPEHMLLKNAGLFLAEMVKARIDFVLHGHQHYAALSKAWYPIDSGEFHTVCVLAGGSVGVGIPPRYYVLTFTDSGEVSVDQRELTQATYQRSWVAPKKLIPYAEARRRRTGALAAQAGATLRIANYARMDRVSADSGDDFIAERFTGVQPLAADRVASIRHVLSSRSGILGVRRYFPPPGQRIDWVWLDARGVDGKRRAETRFEPPLAIGDAISFERTGTIFNAIHFNVRDRLDATDENDDSEYVLAYVGQVFEAMTLHVVFPESHWPKAFRVEARNQNNEIDYQESDYIEPRLSVVDVMRAVVLAIEYPLPSYSYSIVWDLPQDEAAERALTPADSGMATEIINRLLRARGLAALQPCLDRFRAEVSRAFPSTILDESLEVGLMCYDRSARGLVSVAAEGHAKNGGSLTGWVVKPGRGVEGQAFRRREAVSYISDGSSDVGIYEDLPDSLAEPHTLVIAIPIFYPMTPNPGRRVAIARICTRANTSGLLRLGSGPKAGIGALMEYATAWFARDVGRALGLEIQPGGVA